ASHVVARGRSTVALAGPLAGALPGPEAALLGREAALAYEMAVRAGIAPGETAVWLGRGAIADLGRAICVAKGAVAATPTDDELALPPKAPAGALAARLATEGQALAGPLKIFETAARAAGRARAAALAGPGSTLVFLSATAAGSRDDAPLPAALLD